MIKYKILIDLKLGQSQKLKNGEENKVYIVKLINCIKNSRFLQKSNNPLF